MKILCLNHIIAELNLNMVEYEEFELENGLQVIVNQDSRTKLVSVNLLYNVGARDEHPEKTGFAHLFEHLMFGGTKKVPSFDEPLQMVGGENNAFTSNDVTNYYITLPSESLEMALYLEADRMVNLALNDKSILVQKKVVVEEFKQRYLNQPYGDAMLHLRPLAYKKHPYQWATIGKNVEQIENASKVDIVDFFSRFYHPSNAILSISGDVRGFDLEKLTDKWFGKIVSGDRNPNYYPFEEKQEEMRRKDIDANVPADAIYMAFHIPKRSDRNYIVCDLLSDILSSGNSSRLYQKLVREKAMFSNISAYVTGDFDNGLLIVSGRLNPSHELDQGEEAIWKVLEELKQVEIDDIEYNRIRNKVKTLHYFSLSSISNKSMGLAFSKLLGDTNLINTEINDYMRVSKLELKGEAIRLFRRDRANVLRYKRS